MDKVIWQRAQSNKEDMDGSYLNRELLVIRGTVELHLSSFVFPYSKVAETTPNQPTQHSLFDIPD